MRSVRNRSKGGRTVRALAGSHSGYGEKLALLQASFIGDTAQSIAEYCNEMHRRRGDAHGGSWTYGTPRGWSPSGQWEVRVWSQVQSDPLPFDPNMLLRMAYETDGGVRVLLTLGGRVLLSKTYGRDSSAGLIAADGAVAYERALLEAGAALKNRAGRRR